jgi:hypothetical protein
MFTTIKSLIPEPRQADQRRHYVGRHRVPETVTARAAVTVTPGAVPPATQLPPTQPTATHPAAAPEPIAAAGSTASPDPVVAAVGEPVVAAAGEPARTA